MGAVAIGFTSGLLCLLVGQVLGTCSLTDYTLYVEKPECDFCVAINTTICMGFCYSWDSNVVWLPGKWSRAQKICTYQAVEYRTVELPGCPLNVDRLFSYPVALNCHCSTCDPARQQCAHRTSTDEDKCSKPLHHIYPYPGQSNYIQSL
ncbi:hypothetical protein JZ751_017415 [Albula glossodonta]|uniref:Thyrotropin subunit beta n=1 Tax=Albula glossodonta TaxID=121402 RepID=A0A8T2PKI1_9TELE|nr:hypothetical protein JZ751_017415 [Albula glossodonta]